MSTIFRQFQRFTFLRAILYFASGVYALLYPNEFTKWVIYLIAAYVAFTGLLNLFAGIKEKRRYQVVGLPLYLGVFLLIAALGILILAKPLLKLTTIVLGIFLLVNGIMRMMEAFNLKKNNIPFIPWVLYALILIVVGLILMFNAIASVMTLVGSILIFMSLSEVFGSFQLRKMK